MLWGIQQLVNANAYPRFNSLGDSIDAALDGVEVIQQVGCFAKEVATGLGELNAEVVMGLFLQGLTLGLA